MLLRWVTLVVAASVAAAAGVAAGRPSVPASTTTFPGSNGLIAFLAGTNIAIMNSDGTALRVVTPRLVDGWALAPGAPGWSPDGGRIAFAGRLCPPGGGTCLPPRIFVVNWDGTGLRSIAELNARPEHRPAWSPDGAEVAVAVEGHIAAPDRIFAVRADGSGIRAVTTPERDVQTREPIWSPDGRTIAFLRRGLRDRQGIWLVDADGKNERLLLPWNDSTVLWHVHDWSPDGSRILYGEGVRSYTVSPTGERRPFDGPVGVWAPDGSAVVTGYDSGIGVWRVPRQEAGGRRIRDFGRYPDWQRCVPGGAPCRLRVPQVTISRLAITPRNPRSGGQVKAEARVLADGKPLRIIDMSCLAHIGSRPLTLVRKGRRAGGFLSCTWLVPRRSSGLTASLRVKATVDTTVARVPVLTSSGSIRIR